MKKSICGFLALEFLVVCIFFVTPVWLANNLPEPYSFELPKFNGRILPANEVRPGTFTIAEGFENISNWGSDAIMTYGTDHSGKKLVVRAWKPDEKTEGIFRYSEKVIGDSYIFGRVEVQRDADILMVYPKSNDSEIVAMAIFGLVVSLLVFLVGFALCSK